jgi:hypothetical protein
MAETHGAKLQRRDPRGVAALEHRGGEGRALQRLADAFIILVLAQSGDEHRVDAQPDEAFGAAQRGVEPERPVSVSAADDQHLAAGGERGAQLRFDHRLVDDGGGLVGTLLLAVAMLVLDEYGADAELFVGRDHAHDALHVAIAVVAVGEERE